MEGSEASPKEAEAMVRCSVGREVVPNQAREWSAEGLQPERVCASAPVGAGSPQPRVYEKTEAPLDRGAPEDHALSVELKARRL